MIIANKRVVENNAHRFQVGETVTWSGPQSVPRGAGKLTEIVRLLPPLGVDLQYRIKSVDDKHEHVASERDLTPAPQPAKTVFSASSK